MAWACCLCSSLSLVWYFFPRKVELHRFTVPKTFAVPCPLVLAWCNFICDQESCLPRGVLATTYFYCHTGFTMPPSFLIPVPSSFGWVDHNCANLLSKLFEAGCVLQGEGCFRTLWLFEFLLDQQHENFTHRWFAWTNRLFVQDVFSKQGFASLIFQNLDLLISDVEFLLVFHTFVSYLETLVDLY